MANGGPQTAASGSIVPPFVGTVNDLCWKGVVTQSYTKIGTEIRSENHPCVTLCKSSVALCVILL